MINPSKSATSLWSGQTLTAGAGDIFSAVVKLSAAYGAIAHRKIRNGATPPTVEAEIFVELSAEDLRWYEFGSSLKGGTVANAVTSDSVEIPDKARFMRLKAGRNTVQNVTADADASVLDSMT